MQTNRQRSFRSSWKHIAFFLAVMGPGIITACADNDAGGIATYSMVGAEFGYKMLWSLILITISLVVTQEMCVRMGAVTGKGLADLIREQFRVRWTVVAMVVLLVANISTTIADFAGIAASWELFGVSKYISVPMMALVIWYLITRGSYAKVEKAFFALCLLQLTYVVSGLIVQPPWGQVAKSLVVPSFTLSSSFILMFIATIGTTITPWMQFYIQASVVDKGLTAKDYKYARADVIFGSLFSDVVSLFIIVSTAATLFANGIHVETAKDAAQALAPLAGRYASTLFGMGLFGASSLAACILPLSTAYAVCEAFGFESGISKGFDQAPIFYTLFTALVAIGAGTVLIPKLPLMLVMLVSQDVNGMLLPVVLIFMLFLVNNRKLMGEYVNSRLFNTIAWATAVGLILLTVLLLMTSFAPGLLNRFIH